MRRHAAIVGKPDRPSPTLTTSLTAVNLNPTWTVPLGILKKDIRTKMRRDPGYIARMHMRVLDGSGREIDPASVNWNSDGAPNFTVRQDSGTWNALGAVRFDMPNPHSVYLHDTNNRSLFSADYRFQSSGCARIENPRDLAVWLLQGQGDWSRAQIDAAIATGAAAGHPPDPQGAGGLGLSHRLGDRRQRRAFPRRHLQPRRRALACAGRGPALAA